MERLVQRQISQEQVIAVLRRGFIIEEYLADKPYPSALFYGRILNKVPLHVVAAFDERNQWVYIVTVYTPDLKYFESDYKTRRMKK